MELWWMGSYRSEHIRGKWIWPLETSTHHFTEGLGILGELAGIFLLHVPHQPLHFLPLDLLLPLLEGRLALDHLVQQAAQRPPVGAEGVALVFHHLRSWRREGRQQREGFVGAEQWWKKYSDPLLKGAVGKTK